MEWNHLPDELQEKILLTLDFSDQMNAALVCRKWYNIIFSDYNFRRFLSLGAYREQNRVGSLVETSEWRSRILQICSTKEEFVIINFCIWKHRATLKVLHLIGCRYCIWNFLQLQPETLNLLEELEVTIEDQPCEDITWGSYILSNVKIFRWKGSLEDDIRFQLPNASTVEISCNALDRLKLTSAVRDLTITDFPGNRITFGQCMSNLSRLTIKMPSTDTLSALKHLNITELCIMHYEGNISTLCINLMEIRNLQNLSLLLLDNCSVDAATDPISFPELKYFCCTFGTALDSPHTVALVCPKLISFKHAGDTFILQQMTHDALQVLWTRWTPHYLQFFTDHLLPNLRKLKVYVAQLNAELVSCWASHLCQLQSLHLWVNQFDETDPLQDTDRLLSKILDNCPELHQLALRGFRVRFETMQKLRTLLSLQRCTITGPVPVMLRIDGVDRLVIADDHLGSFFIPSDRFRNLIQGTSLYGPPERTLVSWWTSGEDQSNREFYMRM